MSHAALSADRLSAISSAYHDLNDNEQAVVDAQAELLRESLRHVGLGTVTAREILAAIGMRMAVLDKMPDG